MAQKELKTQPAATKDVKFQLSIRVYGEGYKTQESHGFILDDQPMGVSAPVTTMTVNIRILTLQQLRPILMYDQRDRMKKRSMVWQEVLFIMGRLPNIYNRPKEERNLYQFGFCRKDNLQDITLVHPTYENRSIAELIGATDFFSHDLIIVPLTQVSVEVQHAPPPPLPDIPSPDRMDRDSRLRSKFTESIAIDTHRQRSASLSEDAALAAVGSGVGAEASPDRDKDRDRDRDRDGPKKRKVKKKTIKDGVLVDKDA
jgi:hypothetical protein